MNKDLTKFLASLVKLAALSCVSILVMLILGIFVIGCQYEDGYNASLIDKIARLKSINEPKIILVGNSNLSFGMNSAMVEEAINMPVVNLGLHGGLGNVFHENMAKLNINSGDVVIICHSNFSDDDRIIDALLAWITLEYHRDLWDIVRGKDYPSLLQRYPIYWLKALKECILRTVQADTSYTRHSFNKYGDVMKKSENGRVPHEKMFKPGRIERPKINDTCINRLNLLNKFVRQREAVMLVAGYPIGYGEYTPPAEQYKEFQRELASRLDCEVISDYTDYFIPYEYFYDTILHLDEEGTRIRTTQLIKDIKNWQARHN